MCESNSICIATVKIGMTASSAGRPACKPCTVVLRPAYLTN
jgi:hypothetical protein